MQLLLDAQFEADDLAEAGQHLPAHNGIVLADISADAFAPEIHRVIVHVQDLLARVLRMLIEDVAFVRKGHYGGQDDGRAEYCIDGGQQASISARLQNTHQIEQRR